MFERFTERARQVVVLAQDESRALGHDYIGTEHLLLGLMREEEGLAARVLESLDVTLEQARAQVFSVVGRGESAAAGGQIPFTPRAKRVLELSLREALALGHNHIGTEHVLLGLVREEDSVAVRVLASFGADTDVVREEVLHLLSGGAARPHALERRSVTLEGVDEWTEAGPGRGTWGEAERQPLLLAISLAVASFPLGLLVGWLIWG